ncbi:ATP/GTP-binding protein, partial [Brucella abortus]
IPTARPERPGEHPARGQDAIAALVNSQSDEPAQMAGEMADATGNAVAPQPGKTAAFPLPTQTPRADTKLAMVSRRDEIGELIAPPEDDYDYDAKPVAAAAPKQAPAPVQMASAAPTKPAAVASAAMRKKAAIIGKTADTGVRTTTKGARHMAKAPSRPRPVIRPAVMPSSEIAMSTEPVSSTVPVTSPVLRNDALRSAPTMVYTAGFQRGDLPSARANQFSGNAVTFLTVAKFTETN